MGIEHDKSNNSTNPDLKTDLPIQQLRAKLEAAAAEADRAELLDGEEVFDELKNKIEERRRS